MPYISDDYEITVYVHHETDAAILVSEDNDRDNAIWVPKSKITVEKTSRPAVWNITMSETYAAEKGFV